MGRSKKTKKPGNERRAPAKEALAGMGKPVAKVPKIGLAKGRPPTAKPQTTTISSKKGRKKINAFHQLNKQLATAESSGKDAEADELRKRIDDLGGIEEYQKASLQGQAADRGYDSSTVLMEWLQPATSSLKESKPKLRMLEVGALSVNNACSKSKLFNMTRIDLNSQDEGILQQDFMKRPIPTQAGDQFDIISLSLVLNFVPDAVQRGEMLKRTCRFLDTRAPRSMSEKLQNVFPALFLVLPAQSIMNSRYMSEERLTVMMASLGYMMLQRKLSAKLVYYLWQLRDQPVVEEQKFPKTTVNEGPGRNNFCIIIQ